MNQLFRLSVPLGIALLFFADCQRKPSCQISGRWTNREGQDFVFEPDGHALWLLKFGSSYDSFRCNYRLNCATDPAALDLNGFSSGPHTGKTLYGIVEWSSDSSFRLRYAMGSGPEDRPAAFDNEQTQQYFLGK